jgi:6-pyruvoyltetrahydropterin/6-carboxytetrahydropterin synthase
MPVVFITRKAHFNAAHRLHNPAKSDEWNRNTYGKCNSPNWHGHNYQIEVTVAGEPNPETGYVMDLADLHQIILERIIDPCDHSNLNLDVDFLAGVIPSSENLVVAFWNQIEPHIEGARLESIKLFETARNVVEYRGNQ